MYHAINSVEFFSSDTVESVLDIIIVQVERKIKSGFYFDYQIRDDDGCIILDKDDVKECYESYRIAALLAQSG